MSKGDLNFDDLVTGLVQEENLKRNAISDDGWGLSEERTPKRAAVTRRRKSGWILATVGGAVVVIGATTLSLTGFMRPKVEAKEPPQHSDSFATVAIGGTRNASDPVTVTSHDLQAVAPAAAAAPAPADPSQLPAATAARRVTERQRPIPAAGHSTSDDQAADPSALLALADQAKADPEAKAPAAPAAKAEPKPAEAAPAADEAPAETKDLPTSLSRGMIQKGFSQVRGKVAACKDKAPEDTTVISVTAVIDPDGSVEEVQVDDPVGSSPAASCVVAAVKAARFAEFKGEPQTVSYPFPVK